MQIKNKSYYLKRQNGLLLIVFFLFLLSCKPSIPSSVIQPDEMEDILYDYHIADGMANVPDLENKDIQIYRRAVLQKHGVSEAEFDSSMVYYLRHTERLHRIYESLAKRLTNESVALGGFGGASQYASLGTTGDTANVWVESRTCLLNMYEPFNLSLFSLKVDTAFHKGDRLMLNFDTQFIFQDGSRDAVAVLAVKFSNDSIATQNMRLSGTSHYSLVLEDHENLGIKSIKGYFMLNAASDQSAQSLSTFKLLVIKNIQFIRVHKKRGEKPQNKDSMNVVTKPDSSKQIIGTYSIQDQLSIGKINGN